MKKLTKTIAQLEGLKSESSIGNVREILSLAAKVIGCEDANQKEGYGPLFFELINAKDKAEIKAKKLLSKNPDTTFDELVKKVCKR